MACSNIRFGAGVTQEVGMVRLITAVFELFLMSGKGVEGMDSTLNSMKNSRCTVEVLFKCQCLLLLSAHGSLFSSAIYKVFFPHFQKY